MKMKIQNIITTVIFCGLIASLTVASLVNPVRTHSESENRNLAQFPKFTWEALFNEDDDKKWTLKYEEFVTDQFVLRDSWISIKTAAEKLIGKKDSGGVYFGKDGYLIEKYEQNMEQTEANIAVLQGMLEKLGDKYNVKVMLAPTASLVLEDKLPIFAPVWDQAGLIDRVSELGSFVDVRDVLDSHKDEYIYYRTDHHWTSLGAYYAYTELCKTLGIEPLEIGEGGLTKETLSSEFLGTLASKVNYSGSFDILDTYHTDLKLEVNYNQGQRKTDTLYERSFLNKRSKYSVFLNENQPYVEITTENKNGKTLVMVKDSYSHCMVPMLVNHYERIVLIDFRGMNTGLISGVIPMIEKGGEIDDIVILYNAKNFTEERTLAWLDK